MADAGWKTNPGIQAAKGACKAMNATAAIVIFIDDREDTIEYASYGTTGPRCDKAGKLLDRIADFLEASDD